MLAQLSAHEASIESAGFCGVMQLAASCGMDGKLCVWDLNTFGLRHVCAHGAGVVELRWLKNSPLLVTCTVSRELRLYDARDGSCAKRMIGHHDTVRRRPSAKPNSLGRTSTPFPPRHHKPRPGTLLRSGLHAQRHIRDQRLGRLHGAGVGPLTVRCARRLECHGGGRAGSEFWGLRLINYDVRTT